MSRSKTAPKLVLASASPRRVELLNNLGLEFTTIASDIDEHFDSHLSPSQAVIELARRKADAVAKRLQSRPGAFSNSPTVVIGADTIVVNQGTLLGKPATSQEAIDMLSSLSGKVHEVYTGVALIASNGEHLRQRLLTESAVSKVRFRSLDPAEIEAYVATGEPMDKAGSYALQGTGAAFVQSIEGCYTNVIGLPVPQLVSMLRKFGVKILGL